MATRVEPGVEPFEARCAGASARQAFIRTARSAIAAGTLTLDSPPKSPVDGIAGIAVAFAWNEIATGAASSLPGTVFAVISTFEVSPSGRMLTCSASSTLSWPVPSAANVPRIGSMVAPSRSVSGLSESVTRATAVSSAAAVNGAWPAASRVISAWGSPSAARVATIRWVIGVTLTVPDTASPSALSSVTSSRTACTTSGAFGVLPSVQV